MGRITLRSSRVVFNGKLFENRRNRRALSPHLALVEPIEQTRRCIDRDLRGDLDRSGGSAVGPASVGVREGHGRGICRRCHNRSRSYIAKGSIGGTARWLTEDLTYTGLTAAMFSSTT